MIYGSEAARPRAVDLDGGSILGTIGCFVCCVALIANCSAEPASLERRFAVGDGPGIAAVVDANGDGKLDLVVANEKSGDVSVLLGDGRRGFTSAPGSPFPAGQSPNDVAVGDFNRDGRPDLAFANHETQHLTLLLGDGSGGFVPAPNSPIGVAVKPHPHGIATGDFNGDGCPDLVTDSWGDDRLEILLNDGKGGFRAPGIYVSVGKHPYQRIRVADLNGDGKADIVSPNLDGRNVSVLLGDGKGSFVQPAGSPFPCGDSPFNVAVGDANGDGLADLAVVNSPSSTTAGAGRDGLTVLLGAGGGTFRTIVGGPLPLDRFPNIVAMGDVDGDGRADVVVSNPDGNKITIFTMTRRGRVASRRELPVPGHPKGVAIRDLDGDGKGDIVVTSNSARTVTVIFGK